ncbi:sensor histidine kinase [Mucilaginibacter sp. X5P1]|uniref:sensor histidine kinase n=1 Tax=Mucilaginibacter sp. X5P1 TaxID=2723088 RepID=UPI001607F3D9|nr:sensor histidine kinase YesM [Mucilaginibacter sp. X5P1]
MKKNISISLYWKCQLIGWSVAALYWSYIGYSGGRFNVFIGLFQFLSDVFVYILITHLYRNFSIRHKWQQLNLNQLLKRIIPAIFVMGLAYLLVTLIKSYLFRFWLAPDNVPAFMIFFRLNWATMLMAGIRLMAIWLLAYHLYHYAQREINIAKENARLAIIAKDAQLMSLSAQLNPHFLFNSLNNIKALVIENPKSARRAIDLLSDLLRTALYSGDVLLTTVKDELALVKDYFELEKLRFEERLHFCIEADDRLNNVLILRFSIQTLAENAIKHGIAKQKSGGLVSVKIVVVDNYINISVQNPGEFNMDEQNGGLGIKNLTERLQLQYKGKAAFNIINEAGGNVLSTILIPCS